MHCVINKHLLTVQSTGLDGPTSASSSSSRPSMGSFLFAAAERVLYCRRAGKASTVAIRIYSKQIPVTICCR